MNHTFLMILPEGWLEVPDGQAFVDLHTEAQILDLLNSNQLGGVDAMLGDAGLVPVDKTLADFRMFKDAGVYRIFYRLVDL